MLVNCNGESGREEHVLDTSDGFFRSGKICGVCRACDCCVMTEQDAAAEGCAEHSGGWGQPMSWFENGTQTYVFPCKTCGQLLTLQEKEAPNGR